MLGMGDRGVCLERKGKMPGKEGGIPRIEGGLPVKNKMPLLVNMFWSKLKKHAALLLPS